MDELNFYVGGSGIAILRQDGCHRTDDVALGENRHGAGKADLVVALNDIEMAVAGLIAVNLAAFHDALNVGGNFAVGAVLFVQACIGDNDVAVADDDGAGASFIERVGILRSKAEQLADGRIFFENHFAVAVGENFKRIPFADTHGAADFFRDNNSAEVI